MENAEPTLADRIAWFLVLNETQRWLKAPKDNVIREWCSEVEFRSNRPESNKLYNEMHKP